MTSIWRITTEVVEFIEKMNGTNSLVVARQRLERRAHRRRCVAVLPGGQESRGPAQFGEHNLRHLTSKKVAHSLGASKSLEETGAVPARTLGTVGDGFDDSQIGVVEFGRGFKVDRLP